MTKNRMSGHIFLYIPLAIGWLLLVFLCLERVAWESTPVRGLSVVLSLYALGLLYIQSQFKFNFTIAYASYLFISLLGIPTIEFLSPGSIEQFILQVSPYILRWYQAGVVDYAILISALGVTSFVIGASLFSKPKQATQPIIIGLDTQGNQLVYRFGAFLLIISALYLFVMIVSGRFVLFTIYNNLFTTLGTIPGYSYFLVAYATSITLIVATGDRSQIIKMGALYGLIAVILMISGNRGEIFYASAATLAILGRRGMQINTRLVIIILIVFFLIIPFIRQTRNLSIGERQLNNFEFNIGEPFIELGFQLRIINAVVIWTDRGEDFALGGTYILPLQRLIGIVVPFIERPDYSGSLYFFSERLPGQGFSVVGEAYYNYGVPGVIGILGIIGGYLSRFGNTASNKYLAFHGAILAILINNIRNSFIFVPGQILIILGLFALIHLLSKQDTAK